jgi:hypothetical protein
MLQIGNKIYSFDLFEEHFVCDLEKCHGACCVQGDSGAPLEEEEAAILDVLYPAIKPFLRKKAVKFIEKSGKYVIDSDNELVTPLLNGKECVYAVFDGKIAKCGIEKAFHAGKIKFRKPLSCHLYPIRTKKYTEFEAVNYHRWPICKPATVLGKTLNVPVYEFCKDSLVRKFGEAEYKELQVAHVQLKSRGK